MSPSSTVHGGQHDTKYFEVCDIRVANAYAIRGWRNLGFSAWTSSPYNTRFSVAHGPQEVGTVIANTEWLTRCVSQTLNAT